jgi:hypothetical protein
VARANATVTVNAKTDVVGSGRIRHHQLVITFSHLSRGRHRLTLIEVQQGKRTVIGHNTLTVT